MQRAINPCDITLQGGGEVLDAGDRGLHALAQRHDLAHGVLHIAYRLQGLQRDRIQHRLPQFPDGPVDRTRNFVGNSGNGLGDFSDHPLGGRYRGLQRGRRHRLRDLRQGLGCSRQRLQLGRGFSHGRLRSHRRCGASCWLDRGLPEVIFPVGLELDPKLQLPRLAVIGEHGAGVANLRDHPGTPNAAQAIDQLLWLAGIGQGTHRFDLAQASLEARVDHTIEFDLADVAPDKLQCRIAVDPGLFRPSPGLVEGELLVGGRGDFKAKLAQAQHHTFGHVTPRQKIEKETDVLGISRTSPLPDYGWSRASGCADATR